MEEEKELKEELKKNPEFMEFWGKYNKILEEIALLDFILLGGEGKVELAQKFNLDENEINLINQWKGLAEHPMAKKLSVTQLAKTIILDKIKNKDRLYVEMKELQLKMFDTVGMFKEKEAVVEIPEYQITEEDEDDIEKVKKKYVDTDKKGDKDPQRIYIGNRGGITRIHKNDPKFMEKLLKIEEEGFGRFKKEIDKKTSKTKQEVSKEKVKGRKGVTLI